MCICKHVSFLDIHIVYRGQGFGQSFSSHVDLLPTDIVYRTLSVVTIFNGEYNKRNRWHRSSNCTTIAQISSADENYQTGRLTLATNRRPPCRHKTTLLTWIKSLEHYPCSLFGLGGQPASKARPKWQYNPRFTSTVFLRTHTTARVFTGSYVVCVPRCIVGGLFSGNFRTFPINYSAK